MPLPQIPPTWTAVTTGSNEYSIELNDANLETKAWKSSRYDGSQTVTQQLNRFSVGDTTFGKTAAVQKYSRNIYIGNAVIGMDAGGEDVNLFNFPAFSYATTTRYITINNDGSITDNKLESKKTDFDAKRGFYRAFYEDFPLKSDCRIIINDESIKTNLKDKYNVYFNNGQLQKLIGITNPFYAQHFTLHTTGSYYYQIQQNGDKFGATVYFYNENEIRNFYTGSLDVVDGESINLQLDAVYSYLSPFFSDYKTPSEYIGDKRMFISFCTQSGTPTTPSDGNEFTPIRTNIKNNVPVGELHATENLAELSTTEVLSLQSLGGGSVFRINYSPQFQLNQIYDPGDASDSTPLPVAYDLGTIIITRCEDATPSLLLNLPKNEHLPDGVGGKSFVIIPENIHPHIKKNLTHYLAKAGVSLGVDTIPALDNTFETLK